MTGKRWGLEGTPVWVLLYTHGHGTDVWVLQTEEKAVEIAAEVIEDNLEEIEDDDPDAGKEIRKLLKANDRHGAIRAWADYQGDQNYPEELEWRKTAIDSKISAE